jgi:hypothetical protein
MRANIGKRSVFSLAVGCFVFCGVGGVAVASDAGGEDEPYLSEIWYQYFDWSPKKDDKNNQRPIRRIPKGPLLIGPEIPQPRDKPKKDKPKTPSN